MRRALARTGHGALARARFGLALFSLAFGVLREAARPASWRRTVRAQFRRELRQAVGGGLSPTAVTAVLIGLTMVSQTLYWLGEAGQAEIIGTVLVTVMVREVAPLLVGFILLGRSGIVAVAEIATLRLGGQVDALAAQGLDPFLLLVLPRACALAVAAFTLAMVFVPAALITGFVAGSLLGAVATPFWAFLDGVLLAMHATDFIAFPAKMLAMGLLVALTACLTGLEAGARDDAGRVLPRGFIRGTLAILLVSIASSFAA
ncbi:MAG TPA: ABC transporter permease [Stellaceae bacterium]|nr:ABC transporter permease [Stellaceae bacterium]